jgi:hypothetical protein
MLGVGRQQALQCSVGCFAPLFQKLFQHAPQYNKRAS